MKTTEEFNTFHQSTLSTIVEALEAERKKIAQKIYLAGAIAIVFILLYSMINKSEVIEQDLGPGLGKQYSYSGGWSGALFYVALAGAGGYFFWYRPKWRDFRSRFKTELIGRIVKFNDDNLTYNPTDGISRIEFMQSTIFDWAGDRFLSEDLVSGKIGSTSIRFSEVHSQRKQELKSDEDTRGFKRYVTLFKGVAFIADFNKHFKGQTMVLTDVAEKSFGSIGNMFQKMNSMRDPLVKMENTEFEKAFVVYSSDSVEAHYILTPSLQERILSLRSKLGNIQLAFKGSTVFISIPLKQNLFEAKPFESLTSDGAIEKYYAQLKMFTGIVEELNLNTRIWTKE